jgi:hypothetical protein
MVAAWHWHWHWQTNRAPPSTLISDRQALQRPLNEYGQAWLTLKVTWGTEGKREKNKKTGVFKTTPPGVAGINCALCPSNCLVGSNIEWTDYMPPDGCYPSLVTFYMYLELRSRPPLDLPTMSTDSRRPANGGPPDVDAPLFTVHNSRRWWLVAPQVPLPILMKSTTRFTWHCT